VLPLKGARVACCVSGILHKKKVADFFLSPKLGLGLSKLQFGPESGVGCLCARMGMSCCSPWKELR